MTATRTRKPLAKLVGSKCCEDGRHSGAIADLLGWCEHGHGVIGESPDGESSLVKDWNPVKICVNHWRDFSTIAEDGSRFTCSECGHPCVLEVKAEWPGGNSATLRCMPDTGN